MSWWTDIAFRTCRTERCIMIEVILLVLAVLVGLGVVMRMDVEPREALRSEPDDEPSVAGALAAEVRAD
jgi:hypothetical protein